ncbi:TPA: hypothetical protein ACWL5R_005798 [Pseudomonas aeruginosa]|uniref:hypothetical protein n=1 Tax=Pseudomonas aeruginosa TaxID=287 RepID=UPI000E680FFD|nr:hypothetical protein [Pseudomonas aeruginosa]RIY89800.1 hypothetical protein AXW94_30475 [Pseudomonas aeruginosa]RPM25843.1 hypothetical protein IPC1293_31220 [Pseudomonas aeruginosa]HBP4970071.1 hypothetical protein [Pseudomonas aeruginosa]
MNGVTWVAGVVMVAASMTAGAEEEVGPAPLARHFMAQFYDVQPEAVKVTMLDESPRLIVARAEVDGHACRMEMAPAPEGVSARFGWLVGSMQCKQ